MAALQDLRAQLQVQEVQADPLQVGASLLALARAQGWNEKPETLIAWLEDLALDVARNWRHPEMEQAGVDTVPISELKKIAEALRQQRPSSGKP